ncbi:MAG TPA: Ldh family oxidoreductase [Verrucomicrobiota bacterium]|jgi:LDH2 family malate/lactate/ureidoglycolate dehydrogenase|nr:Ldh family oxidoreductase [Verrucomicrobiota bacterium]
MNKSIDQLTNFCRDVFRNAGLNQADSATATTALVAADSWGIHTHGLKNLAGYVRRLNGGGINPLGQAHVAAEGPAWVRVDGGASLGMIGSSFAMQQAVRKAAASGIGYAGLRNSCHFGAAGYYASLAADAGMIGIAMCNDTPTVTVPGARGPVLGSNPIAYAVPAGEQLVLFDIATSTVAGGKVFAAAAVGESVPEGWIVDEQGHPTTDPASFPARATLTPMTAHKGYGLALLAEILSGVLTGAAVAGGVLSYAYEDPSKPTNHGAAFVAIQIEAMMNRDEFEKRMQSLIGQIKNAPKAAGIKHILIPGEREQKYKAKALKEGVNLPDDVWAKLVEVSNSSGVDLPVD